MDSERRPFIATYIEASRPFGVVYIGVTSNLYVRGRQHREGIADGSPKGEAATFWSGSSRSS